MAIHRGQNYAPGIQEAAPTESEFGWASKLLWALWGGGAREREISCPYREINHYSSVQIQIFKQTKISDSLLCGYEPDLLLSSKNTDWQCLSKWMFRSILIPKRGKIR